MLSSKDDCKAEVLQKLQGLEFHNTYKVCYFYSKTNRYVINRVFGSNASTFFTLDTSDDLLLLYYNFCANKILYSV